MAIKYNPNKKTIFNNYIDTAVSNLKRAETETSCILNFTFPSKTIIGRRFDKKSKITTLKGNINSAYTSLSTVRADVQEQVKKYVRENENVALSREKILNNVWNYDYYGDSRTIDSHIKKIRHKLGKKGKYIKTMRGIGYKFETK